MAHIFRLNNLTTLSLHLAVSLDHDIKPITKLTRLTYLSLHLVEPHGDTKSWLPCLPISLEHLTFCSEPMHSKRNGSANSATRKYYRSYSQSLPLTHLLQLRLGGIITASATRSTQAATSRIQIHFACLRLWCGGDIKHPVCTHLKALRLGKTKPNPDPFSQEPVSLEFRQKIHSILGARFVLCGES